ncbi:MAG: hypothetical protein KDA28_04230, partial [Phycisphaerales bacterium]|nr:hypothetical protein [Phycisphaerales bacterium]
MSDLDDLGALASDLREADLAPDTSTLGGVPGVKDGGLTIGIALGGLALSGVSTLIGVLAHWRSTRPRFTVTLKADDMTYTVTGDDKDEILGIASAMRAHASSSRLTVNITPKA